MYLAGESAINKTPFQRISRYIVSRVFTVPRNDDFMADSFVDNGKGHDLDELRRYQAGK